MRIQKRAQLKRHTIITNTLTQLYEKYLGMKRKSSESKNKRIQTQTHETSRYNELSLRKDNKKRQNSYKQQPSRSTVKLTTFFSRFQVLFNSFSNKYFRAKRFAVFPSHDYFLFVCRIFSFKLFSIHTFVHLLRSTFRFSIFLMIAAPTFGYTFPIPLYSTICYCFSSFLVAGLMFGGFFLSSLFLLHQTLILLDAMKLNVSAIH